MMQHLLDGSSWSELCFAAVVAESRFGLVVLGRCGSEARVVCRSAALHGFVGLVEGGVGDVVSVVVGTEGADVVVVVVSGVGGYYYY
jgi:hypothetical protein